VWRPRLVVRSSRGGTISSPTSSQGYALTGWVASSIAVGCVAAALSGEPLLLLGLLVAGLFLRDVWAWYAATPDERAEFRLRVAQLGGGPDQLRIGEGWGLWTVGVLVVAVGTCVALVRVHPVFIVAGMIAGALLVAALLDLARARYRR
jgi:hypothetical protein